MRQQQTGVSKRNVYGTVALLFVVDLSTNQERFIFFEVVSLCLSRLGNMLVDCRELYIQVLMTFFYFRPYLNALQLATVWHFLAIYYTVRQIDRNKQSVSLQSEGRWLRFKGIKEKRKKGSCVRTPRRETVVLPNRFIDDHHHHVRPSLSRQSSIDHT